jgi:hypothetical protein
MSGLVRQIQKETKGKVSEEVERALAHKLSEIGAIHTRWASYYLEAGQQWTRVNDRTPIPPDIEGTLAFAGSLLKGTSPGDWRLGLEETHKIFVDHEDNPSRARVLLTFNKFFHFDHDARLLVHAPAMIRKMGTIIAELTKDSQNPKVA